MPTINSGYVVDARHVIEECSEVIYEFCKADRFGWFSYRPGDKTKEENIDRFEREVNDLRLAIEKLDKWKCVADD